MDIYFKKNTLGQIYKIETMLNNIEQVEELDGQFQAWKLINGEPDLDTSLD